jgi:hypothetical protein
MKKQLLFLVAFAMCSSVYSQEIYLKLARTPRCINILIPMEMKIILSVRNWECI